MKVFTKFLLLYKRMLFKHIDCVNLIIFRGDFEDEFMGPLHSDYKNLLHSTKSHKHTGNACFKDGPKNLNFIY